MISSVVCVMLLGVSIALTVMHQRPMAVVAGVLGLGYLAEVIFVWCPSWELQITRGERMS